jgi:phosphate transport system permease protein
MLNAFFGSIVMSLMGIAFGAPIGVLAGTFLAEYSQKSWIGETVRFVNDILLSAPSIVLGLFVYTLVVAQMGPFLRARRRHRARVHRAAGGGAHHGRDAASGACADARGGAVAGRAAVEGDPAGAVPLLAARHRHGILLALARISGETAPLLFTALNNQYWTTDLLAPMANVPVVIFQYAMSPYESLAHARMGRRLHPHAVRACGQPGRARDRCPQPDDP